jgi:hypothetical protein
MSRNGMGLYYDQLAVIRNGYSRPTSQFGGLGEHFEAGSPIRQMEQRYQPGVDGMGAVRAGNSPLPQTPSVLGEVLMIPPRGNIAIAKRYGSYGTSYRNDGSLMGLGDFDWAYWLSFNPAAAAYGQIKQFFGRPQAWYSQVQQVEESLLLLDNKLFSIGKDAWEEIRKAVAATRKIDAYETVKGTVFTALKAILGADKETMTDGTLAEGRAAINFASGQVDYVSSLIVGEVKARYLTEMNNLIRVLANLPKYGSPSAAARSEFVRQVTNRTAFAAGISMTAIAVAGVALVGFLMLTRK